MTVNLTFKSFSLIFITCLMLNGCKAGKAPVVLSTDRFVGTSPSDINPIEYSAEDDLMSNDWAEFRSQPLTSDTELPTEFLELTLGEAIGFALQDTEVLRSLAATSVLRNAELVPSSFDSAIQSTDPIRGVEAALAAFDTNLNSSALYSNNDDFFNNTTSTANASEVQQDLTALNFGLSKRAATGTLFQIGSDVVHDNTNNPAVGLANSWTTNWEATVRHPLLQGSGTMFNRIAGPTTRSQFQGISGYLISRTNNDISIAQFERSVREMVLEIVDAYWQLDLAYKNFDTVRAARDAALETWNIAKARFNQGLEGGEADRESQAREQYYLFQAQLARSLNGRQDTGAPGVLQAEANLRRLLNLPQSDSRLIMPTDAPVMVESILNWDALVTNSLEGRVELKEQRWRIKQSEMLLLASRNFTMPRLDGVATYRNNGFGDDLVGGSGKFGGAFDEAFAGNYDEWEFGFTFDMPIGFRQAHAGVRNSELRLCRERAVLKEAQRQLLHELGTSVRLVKQAYQNIEWTELRRDAASETVASRQAAFKADAVGFEDLLDSQQRLLEAELDFHRAKTDYELARETLFSNSGQLLSEHLVTLAEGPGCDNSLCNAQ